MAMGTELTIDPFDELTWSDDEKYYFDAIDAALRSRASRYISNGRPEHAAFLVHRFLRHAKEMVRIYSGTLSRNHGGVAVYANDHIVAATHDFLEKGGTLRVVVQEALDIPDDGKVHDHPIVKAAAGTLGTLDIRQANNVTEPLSGFHWMVMDQSAYRLETDIAKAKAHANFGKPDIAKGLADLFDRLYESGTPLVGKTA